MLAYNSFTSSMRATLVSNETSKLSFGNRVAVAMASLDMSFFVVKFS